MIPLLCAVLAAADAPSPRYNIVSIVTDDQARWALGCYGNSECRTPHMDALARDGALLLEAFTATPVCSPSRASFLSGKWGTQVGITDWIAPNEAAAGLGLDAVIWPSVLRDRGYATALVGKWHLGDQPRFHPTKMGFDHFFGFLGGGNKPMNPTLERDGKTVELKGSLPDILTDDAIAFVERNKARPFALLLHFRAPHAPYAPVPDEDSAPFAKLDPTVPATKGSDPAMLKRLTREYYASVHSVDRNLGRLTEALKRLGLEGNTIVSFTSDHGYNIGGHNLLHKGNGTWVAGGVNGPQRPNMFEDSIRIPWIIKWPGVIKPGTRIDRAVSNIDAFATMLGMLDIPMPATVRQFGVDFSPLLRGKEMPPRDAIFAQYDLHNSGLAYLRMIRADGFKFVRHCRSNMADELYDLKADPGETKNLARTAKHLQTREKLRARLVEWMKSIDDPLAAEAAAELPLPVRPAAK